MASTRIADHIGRVLGGRYRLTAAVGTGASAHVFLADDTRLGRRVAVKVLHPALAQDAAFLRRFRAEARAAAALSHPNILAVYDWGEEEDGPYIITEFLGGGSLRAMLDRGRRLSLSQAVLVGLDAARALDYAHRRGLVHRDIKPANLLFDDDGRLRIADFGLARALAEAAWTEPSGAVLGTARYAAPEQVRGVPLDGKADVYSLAVLLVEAVTGRVPFAADTTVGTILSRLERPMEVPEELGPLVPVLTRAGQPDPAARPDATAFGSTLHGLASKMPAPEPLPLAGPAVFDEAEVVIDRDPTEMGISSGDAAGGPTADDVTAPNPDHPTGTIPADGSPAPSVDPPKPAPRRRRWARVMLALAVVLVCTTVAVVAFVQAQVPAHPVPDLSGKPLEEARDQLRLVGFEVVETREYNDEGKPEGTVISQSPAPLTRLKEGKTVRLVVSQGRTPTDVPDLAGMSEDEARAALEAKGLAVGDVTSKHSETAPAGRVLDWEPKSETRRGDAIALTVSAGPAPRTIPLVADRTYEQAAKALQDLGLVPARAERFDDEVAKDRVIGTRPPAGEEVARGATVTIVVSKGRAVVPNLSGKTEAQAREALEANELKLGNAYGPSGGRVVLSLPPAGAQLPRGSSVNIYLG